MNEPEGSVRIQSDSEPCFSTERLKGSGAGWAKTDIPMRNLQKFVNWQADAIHGVTPDVLVTSSTWSGRSFTD